jgi:hypothetical protein
MVLTFAESMQMMQGRGKLSDFTEKAKDIGGRVISSLDRPILRTGAQALSSISNPLARTGFPGEIHYPFTSPTTGLPVLGNFCGPGTNISARVKRGDRGINQVDEVCRQHDIDYSLSGGDPNLVRRADENMITRIDRVESSPHPDVTDRDIKVIRGLIKAKKIGEDLSLLRPGSFGSPDPRDKEMIESMKGTGCSRKIRDDILKQIKGKGRKTSKRSKMANSIADDLVRKMMKGRK